jgi:hypothetical protein
MLIKSAQYKQKSQVLYANTAKANPRTNDGRRVSCTLGGFDTATRIPITLQPVRHLPHLMVPICPENDQATRSAGAHQSDRETDPKTPEPHMLSEGEVDTYRDTDDIIGTNDRECWYECFETRV